MLPSVQRFDGVATATGHAGRLVHGAYHPKLWIFIGQQRDAVVDERLATLGVRRPTLGRRYLGFLLGGDTRVTFGGSDRWFRPGAVVTADARGELGFRTEGTREPLLSISIEWDAEHFGSRRAGGMGVGRLTAIPACRVRVDAVLAAIESAWEDPCATPVLTASVVSLLASLRAEGLDAPRVDAADIAYEPSALERRLSRALDTVLTLRESAPMMTDVESLLGLSGRTVERHLPGVLALWGQSPATFRELRGRHRLFQAALAMSHPAATTEQTARLCGFATPNALCRSFLKAGLPSPGRIRERLHALQ
jgi:AraC-like DNA-binding protein